MMFDAVGQSSGSGRSVRRRSPVLDPKNHARRSVEREGVMREFYAIDYGTHTIWGATAAMIVNLSERLGLR
jgi:hypothetical protein